MYKMYKISKSEVFAMATYIHFKNRFKVHLKYTSLLNSWWTLQFLYFYNFFLLFFPIIFMKVETLEVKISKSILEVYFSLKVKKYIWNLGPFQQNKIPAEVG